MGPTIHYLLKEAYLALEGHVASDIYILTDAHQAYKGDEPLQDVIKFEEALPSIQDMETNSIYCVNKNLFITDGNEIIDITKVIVDQVEINLDPSLHVTHEELKETVRDIKTETPEVALEGIFAKAKAAGYVGTEKTFVAQLAEVLNHTDKIVINEEQDKPVIEIGGEEYTSVAEAFSHVEEGSTLELTANAALDEDVVIDANNVVFNFNDKLLDTGNKTITVSGTGVVIQNANLVSNDIIADPKAAVDSIVINEGASLTIKDSALDIKTCGLIKCTNAELVLDNCTLNGSVPADLAAGAYDSKALIYMEKGTLTMKDGQIICNTSSDEECGLYPIYIRKGNTLVLGDEATGEGPTIIGNSAPIGTNNLDGGIDDITVYGGNYQSLMTHPGFEGVMYLGASANVHIFGGTFDGGDYDLALPYVPADYNVDIHDGVFNGKVVIKKDFKSGGSGPATGDVIAISGGNYAGEVPAEFLAPGYGCAKLPNGRFEVLPINTAGAIFVSVNKGETTEG